VVCEKEKRTINLCGGAWPWPPLVNNDANWCMQSTTSPVRLCHLLVFQCCQPPGVLVLQLSSTAEENEINNQSCEGKNKKKKKNNNWSLCGHHPVCCNKTQNQQSTWGASCIANGRNRSQKTGRGERKEFCCWKNNKCSACCHEYWSITGTNLFTIRRYYLVLVALLVVRAIIPSPSPTMCVGTW